MELIKTILSAASPASYQAISSLLGESEGKVKSGLTALVPTLLGTLLSKSTAATQSGSAEASSAKSSIESTFGLLQSMVTGAGGIDSVLKNPASVLKGSNSGIEQDLLTSFFGNKGSTILQTLQGVSGLSIKSLTSLLGVAAPLVFGGLKKSVEDTGAQFTPASMMGILKSSSPEIMKMLPAGLGSVVGLTGLASSISQAATGTIPSSKIAAATQPNFGKQKENKTWGYTPLVLGLLGLSAYWLYSANTNTLTTDQALNTGNQQVQEEPKIQGEQDPAGIGLDNESDAARLEETDSMRARAELGEDASVTGGLPSEEQEVVKEAMPEGVVVDEAGNAVDQEEIAGILSRQLPSGVSISFASGSVENSLLAFVEDSSKPVDTTSWFNFDKLNFETASSRITADSQPQIKNIEAILSAYPQLAIKIGGYTDNTGNEAANLKLSADRAKATVTALTELGIAPERLTYEGYGSQFPIASNDTPEGRTMNRRISVRVTSK
jgi:OmpA-OmpF porin, OOP family